VDILYLVDTSVGEPLSNLVIKTLIKKRQLNTLNT